MLELDELVALQETALNIFRCRFDVDTHVVPEGCDNGRPAGGDIKPAPFEGTPTPAEFTVRNRLLNAQLSLLSAYSCLFGIDTWITPDDCHR